MNYEEFEKHMAEKFPRYFGEGKHYGGFCIGEGWFLIIEKLVSEIDHYTKWRRNMRANDLKKVRARNKGYDALLKTLQGKSKEPNDWDIERTEEIMEHGVDVTPKLDWITVQQIKEKFGGLRFYYDGGDQQIHGMVRMAEIWASNTCETCGNKGVSRTGGWVRTLCDHHEELYQSRKNDD